ncbi:hypothetical protein QFC21_006673 [Naganishia friedmannii]|uniref:Uncharacterized protein n=1 Tax=Naganishia friedmannii TaxID=89922 RepID=A0ACC2V0N2_9TREE|nr:hypothetical protein QFC21_006673 [Naganishia friedmannii]
MNGWQWNTKSRKCVPKDCEAPEPDCSDWEDSTQCCHHTPTPSKKPGNGGGYGTGHGTGYKRDLRKARLREKDQGQAAWRNDEVDATFCPAPLKACAVTATHLATSPEWAYECIDTDREVDSCGGCVAEGIGVDCSSLLGVASVGCERGVCKAQQGPSLTKM